MLFVVSIPTDYIDGVRYQQIRAEGGNAYRRAFPTMYELLPLQRNKDYTSAIDTIIAVCTRQLYFAHPLNISFFR